MANVKQGTLTRPPQWWKHLRDWNEVATDADAMKDSKFVTDAGRMLHEGMWGGATNSIVTIKNRFGVE